MVSDTLFFVHKATSMHAFNTTSVRIVIVTSHFGKETKLESHRHVLEALVSGKDQWELVNCINTD